MAVSAHGGSPDFKAFLAQARPSLPWVLLWIRDKFCPVLTIRDEWGSQPLWRGNDETKNTPRWAASSGSAACFSQRHTKPTAASQGGAHSVIVCSTKASAESALRRWNEFSPPHKNLLPCDWEDSLLSLVSIPFASLYVLMADFPFVSHDPEFNATIILKRNITPSSEKSKGPKNVCTILMHEYFYTYIKYRK